MNAILKNIIILMKKKLVKDQLSTASIKTKKKSKCKNL